MAGSLIEKYPHLKSLLQEEEKESESSSVKSGGKSLLGPGGPVTAKSSVRSGGQRTTERKRPPFKAEELFARSMGADRDHWLGFQVRTINYNSYKNLLFFPGNINWGRD